MENPRSQTKVAMNYGAMYGLTTAAASLIFYFIGTDMQSKLPQFTSYLLLILFLVLGIKSYRDTDLGGFISYGKSVGTGTLIALFGGIITGAFSILLFTVIAPDMADRILEGAQEKLAQQGMSEEQMQMGLEMTKKFMTPGWLFVFSILGSALMGLIFSLIISIFMKKESNPFSSNIG